MTRQVGIAGEFLSHGHTREHFRAELFEPSVLLRRKRDAWREEGSRSLAEVAEARAEALIAEPVADALSDTQRAAMRDIEEAYLRQLAI